MGQQKMVGQCHHKPQKEPNQKDKPQKEPNQKDEGAPHIECHNNQSPHEDDNALEVDGLRRTPHRLDNQKRWITPHDKGEVLVDMLGGTIVSPE